MTTADGASELLSLPQGGGAQHGIGETFTPDLHTGTANTSVPIKLPPGRNGLEPQLNLRYSSGGPNGPFGLGWELSVPAVTRKTTRGVPQYGARDTFLLAGAEDLVPVPGAPSGAQHYRPRTESLFALIDHVGAGTDHWEVRTKDGRKSVYGTPRPAAAPANWTDPATVRHPSLGTARTFGWRLTENRDALGNHVSYRYRRDAGQDGPHHWDQLYLQDVRYVEYGPPAARQFLVSVRFVYDDEPDPIDGGTQVERPDPFSDYRGGFEIRTRRRCTWIVVTTHTDDDHRVRAYRLVYLDERKDLADLRERLPMNGVSLLSQVELVGFDDRDHAVHEFPALEFGYTRFDPSQRTFTPLGGADLPDVSLADPSLELVDLTGDGLPDLLETNETVRYWRNTGEGTFDPPRMMDSAPGDARLQDQGIQLLDANGDGRLDLVTTTETGAGYFPLRPDGAFDRRSFRPYAAAPSFSLEDPEVRLVDIDGDGITDAVRSGARLECFFNDAALGWTAGAVRQVERRSLDQFPNVNFADPRVRFADMNGDGLQDVVLVYDGNVEVWPSLGRGDFGARVHMTRSPHFPYGYDPRRVLLGDVDGDGLADLVYVDSDRVTVWINRSGNDWSDPVTIHGTPPVTDVDAVRLADVFGSGVAGVLWSTEPRGQPRETLFFLNVIGGVKPYLLDTVDNGIGAVTRIGYSTSTRFYVEDGRHRRTRWRSTLPFPVHVVARVEVIDQVSKGKLTSEFSYHNGYWDGFEREARGFGRVGRRDTQESTVYNAPGLHGDAEFAPVMQFSPPVLVKTWFHQGPVADASGEWGESDFVDEYWQPDRQVLQRPQETVQLLGSLPRSARRDALRALRGGILRTEMYALDGTARAAAPYTVTERISALREESPPTAAEAGRSRIFFPHLVAERTTQWERGSDPLTRIELTGDYDEWGQPCRRTRAALPRRSALRQPGGTVAGGDEDRVLATHTLTEFAVPDGGLHLHDRVAHERTFVLTAPPGLAETDPTDLASVIADQATAASSVDGTFRTLLQAWQPGDSIPNGLDLIGHVVTHYDGSPSRVFLGRNPGKVGPYGVVVRTEALAFTSGLLDAAYGGQRPAYLGGPKPLPAGAPGAFGADLGYHLRQRSADGYHDGYYVNRERMKLDFHVAGASDPRGLTLAVEDPLGRQITFGHDAYDYFRTQVTDAAGLTTKAKHDYRALQPELLTDPNGNRTRFVYTPLGLLESIARLGKANDPEGDSARASRRFAYSFGTIPISAHTTLFVHHDTEPGLSADQLAEAVEKVEYSDGFGRLVQVRARAEDVLFDRPGSAPLFGDSGLRVDQSQPVAAASGRRRAANAALNVVVSGARTFDNKGRVIEAYEPYFSRGLAYDSPTGSELGRKTTYAYDPRGTVVRTTFPGGGLQQAVFGVPADLTQPDQVEPSPWQVTLYDANDGAGRTPAADPQASEYRHHWDTPTTHTVDALGRTISTIERTRAPWAAGAPPTPVRELRTWTAFDVRGNVASIVDAFGRTVLAGVFDVLDRPLCTTTLDGGTRLAILDAFGNVVEHRTQRGGVVLREFDLLNRLAALWARDDATAHLGLRERFEYGDGGTPAQATAERTAARAANALGRLTRVYDQAGLVELGSYDFKGNLLDKVRQAIDDSEVLAVFGPPAPPGWKVPAFRADWQGAAPPSLDAKRFELSFAYDALDRLTSIRYPSSTPARKRLTPTWDPAGQLMSVDLDGTTFVERIAYNARGRRTLIAYQGLMTRYAYGDEDGRLRRLRTEPYTASDAGRTLTPAGTLLQDHGIGYDLTGNVVALSDRTPEAGIPGTVPGADALDRTFAYDPLYRLVEATGRESATIAAPWPQDLRGTSPAATRGYAEHYAYDDGGNLADLRRDPAATGFGRTFSLVAGRSRLASVSENGTKRTYVYDANGNVTKEGARRHFDWDYGDRLRAFRVQQGTAAPSTYTHYLYDSTGQLVKKLTWDGPAGYETTTYVESFFEHRARVRAGATTEHDLLHLMDDRRRIAAVRVGPDLDGSTAAPVVYHLADHLGSANVVIEPSATIVSREEWFPYGETSFGGSARNRYRFTGKERDSESGLAYHGNRWYAPWLGRWMSCDPLPPSRPSQACNQYAYVRGNPLSFVDPSGLQEDLPDDLVAGEAGRNGPIPQEQTELPPLPADMPPEVRKAYIDRLRTIGAYRSWANRDPLTGKPIPPRSSTTKTEKKIFLIGDIARGLLLTAVTTPFLWEWLGARLLGGAAEATAGSAAMDVPIAPAAEQYFVGNTASPELARTIEALQADGVPLRGNFVHVTQDSPFYPSVVNHGGAYHQLTGQWKGTTFVNMDTIGNGVNDASLGTFLSPKQVLQHEMGHFGQAVIQGDAKSLEAFAQYAEREAAASGNAALRATDAADKAALENHMVRNLDQATTARQLMK